MEIQPDDEPDTISIQDAKHHKYDIRLEQYKWIPFVELDKQGFGVVEVDAPLMRVKDLWNILETECVAGCCGVDAFDFESIALLWKHKDIDVERIHQGLSEARKEIAALSATVLSSNRLNQLFDKRILLTLLDYLIDKIPKSNARERRK